eukprot:Awhi_evm1s7230
MTDYLVFGSTGYLGTILCELLEKRGASYKKAKSRIQNIHDVEVELDEVKPKYVLHAAGLTGRPNIDWCEEHKLETIQVNVFGTLGLANSCFKRNIHMTNYATGCIYNQVYEGPYDPNVPPQIFSESDAPNWTGSFYSVTKTQAEFLVNEFPNVLTLRIRMPITGELHPRNFITKISKYPKLINYPNSISNLDDVLPVSLDMTAEGRKGLYNFTNPGFITHFEIMELYKKHVDPDHTWEGFSVEEQNKILKSGRCNCCLDTSKLEAIHPIPNIKESVERVFENIAKNK